MQRPVLALIALAACLSFAACGGDDEESASSGGAATGDVTTLEITATGDKKSVAYEVAAEADAGVTEITMTNDSAQPVDGQLVRVDGEHSPTEIGAELSNAMGGKPVAEWFHAVGGVGGVEPGESGSVTQVLDPGTYYVVGAEELPEEPVTFTVTGETGAELPEADGSVEAAEYAFSGDAKSGPGATLALVNKGNEWHHFIAAPIIGDATLDEVKAFFETEKGKPPIDFENTGVESTVMDGGVAQIVETDLKPGRYAFACFVADREGGPPHIAKGMISEIEVQ